MFIYYFWLCWVFVSVRGPPPVAASGGHSSSRCTGLSPSRPLLLRSRGSRCSGSAVVAHGPSRSAARGILPDQGPNPCPLHRQADPQPPRHKGSPWGFFLRWQKCYKIWLWWLLYNSMNTLETVELYVLWMNCRYMNYMWVDLFF